MKRTASASGIDDVRCPRKFALRNLIPRNERLPPGKAAFFGKRLHKVAEDYHKEAKPPDPSAPEGKAFLKGLHLNPPPMEWRVEGYFAMEVMGIEFRGYKDLERRGAGKDHKTSSAPELAARELKPEKNPQGIIYAFDGMQRYDTSTYEFTWIYYPSPAARTKDKPIARTHVYEASTIIDQFWEYCYKPALVIADIRERWTGNPMVFKPNYRICEEYGGCPYKNLCGVP